MIAVLIYGNCCGEDDVFAVFVVGVVKMVLVGVHMVMRVNQK